MPEQKLILIVDDEEVIREILCGFLEKKGYETVSVPDGSSALSFAEKKKPDIVLLDIKMPGVDGLETCSRLSQLLQYPPRTGIIILTGYDSPENIAKSFTSGAIDVIAKPLDLKDINNRINTWLDIRNRESEPSQILAYLEKVTGRKFTD